MDVDWSLNAPGVDNTILLAVLSSWAITVEDAGFPEGLVFSVDFEGAGDGQEGSDDDQLHFSYQIIIDKLQALPNL